MLGFTYLNLNPLCVTNWLIGSRRKALLGQFPN